MTERQTWYEGEAGSWTYDSLPSTLKGKTLMSVLITSGSTSGIGTYNIYRHGKGQSSSSVALGIETYGVGEYNGALAKRYHVAVTKMTRYPQIPRVVVIHIAGPVGFQPKQMVKKR